jgi:hypothetical protein
MSGAQTAVGGDGGGTSGSRAAPPHAKAASEKSLLQRFLAEVRGWPPAIVGMIVAAVIGLLLAGVWPTLFGPGSTGFHGFILGPSGTAVHRAPTLSSQQVGDLPSGAGVVVGCTTTGDAVVGPRHGGGTLTSRIWDKVRPEGAETAVGFVPDALVKTGTIKPVAPAC